MLMYTTVFYKQNGIKNSGCFWFFAGFCVLSFIYCFLFVKETKGKTSQQIGEMFGSPAAVKQDDKAKLEVYEQNIEPDDRINRNRLIFVKVVFYFLTKTVHNSEFLEFSSLPVFFLFQHISLE